MLKNPKHIVIGSVLSLALVLYFGLNAFASNQSSGYFTQIIPIDIKVGLVLPSNDFLMPEATLAALFQEDFLAEKLPEELSGEELPDEELPKTTAPSEASEEENVSAAFAALFGIDIPETTEIPEAADELGITETPELTEYSDHDPDLYLPDISDEAEASEPSEISEEQAEDTASDTEEDMRETNSFRDRARLIFPIIDDAAGQN